MVLGTTSIFWHFFRFNIEALGDLLFRLFEFSSLFFTGVIAEASTVINWLLIPVLITVLDSLAAANFKSSSATTVSKAIKSSSDWSWTGPSPGLTMTLRFPVILCSLLTCWLKFRRLWNFLPHFSITQRYLKRAQCGNQSILEIS